MKKGQKESWDRISSFYDPFTKKYGDIYRVIIHDMKERMAPEKKLLEIGTATGILTFMLADYMEEIRAIDYSEKMIALARSKLEKLGYSHISFDVGDTCALAYPDNAFDYILIANVLHIIPDPNKALQEIRRVLKNDGVLFAPTFTHKDNKKADLFSFFAGLIGFKAYSKWTPDGYSEFLDAQGFQVFYHQTFKSSFPEAYAVCRKKLF